MIIRLSAFYESFRDGQIPTRFLQRLNQGYGYPVSNFLYPGFLYLGVPIHILGFSFVNTIKLLFGTCIVGSTLFMYRWLRRFFDEISSAVGGLVYTYLPYHLFDLYRRGSVGEMLSLAVFPFVAWQIERKSIFWGAVGIALLVLSHNTLAVFFQGFLLLYLALDLAVTKEKREAFFVYLKILLLGLGLAAFFWIPAVFDLHYTIFSQTTIANWNEYFADVWLVGIESYLVFIVALIIFFTHRVKPNRHRLTLLMLFTGLVATYFATPFSSIFWRVLPVSFVQFPFRFLSLTLISVAFLTGFIFSVSSKKERIVAGIILLVLLSSSLWSSIGRVHYTEKPESFYTTNLDTTTVHNEYMPIYVKQPPVDWSIQKVTTTNGSLESVSQRSNSISFVTNSKREALYVVQKVYFPGWNVQIDGRNARFGYSNTGGLIAISIPSGRHVVRAFYGETMPHFLSDLLSIVSFAVLIFMAIAQQKRSSP